MKSAIDLYSGIGGWTLGMKLSGINNLASYEWWHEANQTHNINFGTDHNEINIREIDMDSIAYLKGKTDFVVGSPPCTQFSYANRGGNGDVNDGLIDIYKFLEIVEYIRPKYWAMENVPRVATILENELESGCLARFRSLVSNIVIVDTADYGVPQNRKRMVAGHFPFNLFESYKANIKQITLGEVMGAMNSDEVTDPNYGYKMPKEKVSELENEFDLTIEEERINKDSKTYHPVYNKMAFPDRLDRPSRTVTATCTRVSRESIIIPSDNGGFRRLNVRERGVVQGFPITYQFYGRTLNAKFKMIGNAVPPILTYYIFQSMLEVPKVEIKPPSLSNYFHEPPKLKAYKSNLDLPKRRYPANRRFQFSVPNLRFGSGVRFELSNVGEKGANDWSFKFYFGTSKSIKTVELDNDVKNLLSPILNTSRNQVFTECVNRVANKYSSLDSKKLQELWVSTDNTHEVFEFLDLVGKCVSKIQHDAEMDGFSDTLIAKILKEYNSKLQENKESVLIGFYFLSSLNHKLFKS